MALSFTSPIMIALLARVGLGERAVACVLIAIAVGFVRVLTGLAMPSGACVAWRPWNRVSRLVLTCSGSERRRRGMPRPSPGTSTPAMRPHVFIHTNHRQLVGALVSAHSMRSRSRHADRFDVSLIRAEDYPFLALHEGRAYLRAGMRLPWRNDDLQSFTPLRFMPPELMGYEGRALLVDPDVFALADVWELLSRDMRGKAILCRTHTGIKRTVRGRYASSVMLLDCAKLTHWRTEAQFKEMFAFTRDYRTWIGLDYEDPTTIGSLEPWWNDFDHLAPETRLLHNTRRITQPWKTGLPIDFQPVEHFPLFPPFGWLMTARRKLLGEHALLGRYRRHPEARQEALFFALLGECLETGEASAALLREEMRREHLRHDALELAAAAPPVDAVLGNQKANRAAAAAGA